MFNIKLSSVIDNLLLSLACSRRVSRICGSFFVHKFSRVDSSVLAENYVHENVNDTIYPNPQIPIAQYRKTTVLHHFLDVLMSKGSGYDGRNERGFICGHLNLLARILLSEVLKLLS